ncbi:hypothetical protein [Sulfitobacter sp. PS-8MA]|uniref:hypothetical protein n=1 Tax=Sulfitobacter sp. PS-8MA TaxID=3237707 RepID=UPI0034C66A10
MHHITASLRFARAVPARHREVDTFPCDFNDLQLLGDIHGFAIAILDALFSSGG